MKGRAMRRWPDDRGSAAVEVASGRCHRRLVDRSAGSLVFAGLGGATLVLASLLACTEKNPDYDPDAYCTAGERRCAGELVVEVCMPSNEWPDLSSGEPWVQDCWDGTTCDEGACVPSPVQPCVTQADCSGSDVCTILVDPGWSDRLATFCIPSPNPSGFESGVACNSGDQCKSGRCTRQVCFSACQSPSDCSTDGYECVGLELTIDGVRSNKTVSGCVPVSQ